MGWDDYFLNIVDAVASKSKDTSVQVGAIIVNKNNSIVSTGYNGFPRGVSDHIDNRDQSPTKHIYTVHAETNAIYNAARHGIKLEGCTLYVRFPQGSCIECCKAIIQSGINTVVVGYSHYVSNNPTWLGNKKIANLILKEAKVVLIEYDIRGNKKLTM
jgi:dCMP deaminase